VYRTLLAQSALAVLLCAALVTLCYFFVDRPVAFFVQQQQFHRFAILYWLQDWPPLLQTWAPVALAALAVRRALGPLRRWQRTLLAASVSLLVAVQCKDTLKYAFGRSWPDTWIDDNPSLLSNDVYGFHPFHGGMGYASFPSGHTTRTVAFVAVFWLAYPAWRWACVAATGAVAVGLIGMNYHFVGDIIAGGFVGGIVAAYTTTLCGLGRWGSLAAVGPSACASEEDHKPVVKAESAVRQR
jgi:membrane-associated phospholipid phosphatase